MQIECTPKTIFMKPALPSELNEQLASVAFDKQSVLFDALYQSNSIISYKRTRVRDHAGKFLSANSHILELNAGTGEDAIYFARKGHRVHATDIAPGMQERMKQKVEQEGLTGAISHELCSFNRLDDLVEKGPYDMIFSNFAGLNCTGELSHILHSFYPLLKPRGVVTLVIMPPFCLWETMLFFRGKFKTATRRFFAGNGVAAHIEGEYFRCWYYPPSYISSQLRESFDLKAIEGLCTLVPPSYIEQFAEKYPRAYQFLVNLENRYKENWPWKYMGDYYIISLSKKD
jgi:ubiquinone/menaquinone biosynthesis C-methylase UbiE